MTGIRWYLVLSFLIFWIAAFFPLKWSYNGSHQHPTNSFCSNDIKSWSFKRNLKSISTQICVFLLITTSLEPMVVQAALLSHYCFITGRVWFDEWDAVWIITYLLYNWSILTCCLWGALNWFGLFFLFWFSVRSLIRLCVSFHTLYWLLLL